MSQQLGENYKEIIMNVDVETMDNLLEYVTLWTAQIYDTFYEFDTERGTFKRVYYRIKKF